MQRVVCVTLYLRNIPLRQIAVLALINFDAELAAMAQLQSFPRIFGFTFRRIRMKFFYRTAIRTLLGPEWTKKSKEVLERTGAQDIFLYGRSDRRKGR
jgi:hypothetical protein